MTDEELILKWNELKNRIYNKETVSIEDIKELHSYIQDSYKNNQITQKQYIKYAELMCYLNN